MSKKLTLTLEKEVIAMAKDFAKEQGQSLSELVENYFKLLTKDNESDNPVELSPKVKSLKGVLKVGKDFDYKKVLEEEILKKYG
ncbi:MAG TPA: DUF6364 family protein [Pricia sp.]|nr:DUF6364 family protein [Pricia sp.]